MSHEHYKESLNFVTTSAGKLAFSDVGSSDVVAVFVHGLPLCSYQWD